MEGKTHSEKVRAKAVEKQSKSPFRCDNCGATFVSEAKKHAHELKQHREQVRKAG